MGICLRYTRTREQAEDLAQEAIIKVFERLPRFRGEGSFEGWVHRIAVTTAIDHYREQIRKGPELALDEAELTPDNNDLFAQLSAQDVLALMNRLPDGYRLVLNLYALEGYTHKEISEQLGIEEKTSSSQLCRARKMMLALVQNQEIIPDYGSERRKSV